MTNIYLSMRQRGHQFINIAMLFCILWNGDSFLFVIRIGCTMYKWTYFMVKKKHYEVLQLQINKKYLQFLIPEIYTIICSSLSFGIENKFILNDLQELVHWSTFRHIDVELAIRRKRHVQIILCLRFMTICHSLLSNNRALIFPAPVFALNALFGVLICSYTFWKFPIGFSSLFEIN